MEPSRNKGRAAGYAHNDRVNMENELHGADEPAGHLVEYDYQEVLAAVNGNYLEFVTFGDFDPDFMAHLFDRLDVNDWEVEIGSIDEIEGLFSESDETGNDNLERDYVACFCPTCRGHDARALQELLPNDELVEYEQLDVVQVEIVEEQASSDAEDESSDTEADSKGTNDDTVEHVTINTFFFN